MNNQKGSASSIFIVVLALVIVGLLGYIVWQKTSEKADTTTTDNTISTPSNIKTVPNTIPSPNTRTFKVAGYTFEAPTSWTKFTQMPDVDNAWAMDVQGSLPANSTTINRAYISISPTKEVDMNYGGGSLYTYNKTTNTWNAIPQQPVKDFKGVTANFVGDGLDGQYSLTAKYVRVLGNEAVVVTVQESGAEGKEYSFTGGNAPYKSNNLQNDIVSVLESVKK